MGYIRIDFNICFALLDLAVKAGVRVADLLKVCTPCFFHVCNVIKAKTSGSQFIL